MPRTAPRGQPFDAMAALLTATTFAAAIWPAWPRPRSAAPASCVLALALTALGCGGLLLRRQAGQAAPMLPVDLLRRPLFALSVATSMASFAAQSLAFVSLPFFIETVLQRDAVQTGFLIAPWAIVVAAGRAAGRPAVRALCAGPDGRHRPAAAERRPGLAGAAHARGDRPRAIVLRMALCGAGLRACSSRPT